MSYLTHSSVKFVATENPEFQIILMIGHLKRKKAHLIFEYFKTALQLYLVFSKLKVKLKHHCSFDCKAHRYTIQD